MSSNLQSIRLTLIGCKESERFKRCFLIVCKFFKQMKFFFRKKNKKKEKFIHLIHWWS